jgi:hypothetical protein
MELSKEASKKGFKVALLGTGSYTCVLLACTSSSLRCADASAFSTCSQLGGVALVSKEGISFFHQCQATWDYPEVDDMLARCPSQE